MDHIQRARDSFLSERDSPIKKSRQSARVGIGHMSVLLAHNECRIPMKYPKIIQSKKFILIMDGS